MRDKILVIDDELNIRKILEAVLNRNGFEVYCFESLDSAIETLNTEQIAVVVTDLSMPGHSGIDVLKYCKNYSPDLPVILITAYGSIEAAVTALKNGAFDFILKPFDHDDFLRIIQKAIETRRRKNREPEMEIISAQGIGPVPVPLFGSEPSTHQLRKTVERISGTRSNIYMSGEIGSGKRSVAYEIHRKSDRSAGPFVQVQCDAIPSVFQLSELMGTEKGPNPMSFFSKPGSFELGMGGTILLDEVDALAIDAQNAIFTMLQDEQFSRLHGARRFPVDFRIITSSSKDISQLVRDGNFHPELFALLSIEKIELKPLRERKRDIDSELLNYFVEKACRKRGIPVVACDEDAIQWFMNQDWPGNLGELERTVEKVMNHWKSGKINRALLSLAGFP